MPLCAVLVRGFELFLFALPRACEESIVFVVSWLQTNIHDDFSPFIEFA